MSAVHDLSDHAVELLADADPLLATFSGIAGRDHRWTDLSPDGYQRRGELAAHLRNEAEATDATSPEDVLAKRVLIEDLTLSIDALEAGQHLSDLNSIASPFQSVMGVFDLMTRTDLDGWSRVLVRLETIDGPLAGLRETLAAGLDAGVAVAARQVRAVIDEARVTAGRDGVFAALVPELAEQGLGDDGTRDRLAAAVDYAGNAAAAFADWLESEYLPGAPEAEGVGLERYLQAARRHLGTVIDPVDAYTWGWAEYRRLQDRLAAVCAQIDPDASVAEVIARLSTDPEMAAATVAEFLEVMQARQQRALDDLSDIHFDVPEAIRTIEVKAAPPGGSLAPYYTPPSEDFSRPGAVWYPLGDRAAFPLFGEVSTAHHEGFPGHHLQIGVQLTRGESLSRYHRVLVWMPGSGEGWALYAERFMDEQGFLDEPQFEVGFLLYQVVRACRVILDIGLHLGLPIPDDADFHPGEPWTFDLAVAMLMERAYQQEPMSRSEVTRYLGWPGQAISYKIGEKTILELREELVGTRGVALKEFHTRVLSAGSIGLDLLRELTLG